jgi:glycosyltransferase involved in cell wall biosynthesis
MPRFSIITTCKGRLAHLRQSLPRFLQQADSETVVVDYDCPDGTTAAVERDFPPARVVAVREAPLFNPAHARNLGAAAAQGEWLVFVDADILVAPDFLETAAAGLKGPGTVFRFGATKDGVRGINGTCILHRDDFAALGGYDEVLDCYGGEDNDLYFRLELLGVRSQMLDTALVDAILTHDDAARVRFTRFGSKPRQQRINSAYLLVKGTLLRQLGAAGLAEPQRRQLYGLVRDVVERAGTQPDQPIQFTMDLPPDPALMPLPAWDCVRRLVFELRPEPEA